MLVSSEAREPTCRYFHGRVNYFNVMTSVKSLTTFRLAISFKVCKHWRNCCKKYATSGERIFITRAFVLVYLIFHLDTTAINEFTKEMQPIYAKRICQNRV